eukprot:TRINITY_DN7913_c0_g4_i2.p1 TRINITY_DN7913_c0_g4~~TRINITY_DN7913_c0_g4_i2.p1  ORF type:complete len:131 (-),score=28.96 TRINITY_DN7913_c0_g4_i2:98-490(-)
MAPLYYRNASAAILVYDVSSSESWESMLYWIGELERNVGKDKLVLSIAANKCDGEINVDPEMAKRFASHIGASYVTTSAKLNQGVEELFLEMSKLLLKKAKQSNSGNDADLELPTRSVGSSPSSKGLCCG